MSERRRGRKRHIVQGEVKKIERKGEGLGLEQVGDNGGLFRRMFSFFRKNRNNG